MTADDLLRNKWINQAEQKYTQLSKCYVKKVFKNLRLFKISYEIQRAVLMQMTKTDIEKKEYDTLKIIFDALDDDKSGEIELKEFVI